MRSNYSKSSKKPGKARSVSPGFLRRLAAIAYDTLLLLAVLFLATALALPFNSGDAFTSKQWFFPLYLLLVTFGFFAWFWTHGGQTLGMRAWKVKLVSQQGLTVSWQQALVRFGVAFLSWLCFGLGFFWCWLDKSGYSWHDHASATRLVWADSEKG